MDDNYDYRPKFTDIRIKPPADDKSRAKAKETRTCEHKSCDLAGEFPAPKHNGNGKHWFCKRHAAEYNKSFNFFDGMTAAEAKSFQESARHDHKQTWKLGTGPVTGKKAKAYTDPRKLKGRELFEDGVTGIAREQRRGRTRLQLKSLTELDLSSDATAADIRARYADYVRRFHPDSNDGDRSAEDKLARVIKAFKTLKAAGLTKD